VSAYDELSNFLEATCDGGKRCREVEETQGEKEGEAGTADLSFVSCLSPHGLLSPQGRRADAVSGEGDPAQQPSIDRIDDGEQDLVQQSSLEQDAGAGGICPPQDLGR
jgi:hypothetical protein